jgi:hypothetical protein
VPGDGIESEVGGGAAGGEDEVVVGKLSLVGHDAALIEVDTGNVGEPEAGVARADDAPDRVGDSLRLEAGRGHLVEEGDESVVVIAVDDGDADGSVLERAGGGQATEASADDYYVRTRICDCFHNNILALRSHS